MQPSATTCSFDFFGDHARLSEPEQDYLFDLLGFRVLHGAIGPDLLAQINAWVDAQDLDGLKPGDWLGNVEVHTYGASDGVNFQNVIEAGDAFEQLIDHPVWIEPCRRFIENRSHTLAIDENFLNVRNTGGYIPIHSGGTNPRFTSVFRHTQGGFAVGQINILMALTDIGPGDGATTLIPASHKSLVQHPQNADNQAWQRGVGGNEAVGMMEVHLKAGDALMFTDAITHGSTPRTNPGQRRVMIYRYAPHLLATRFNYVPSEELLARLTEARRKLVQPTPPRLRPGRAISAESFSHSAVGG